MNKNLSTMKELTERFEKWSRGALTTRTKREYSDTCTDILLMRTTMLSQMFQ